MMISRNIIDDAYNQLSKAYYIKRDRKSIEESCKHCQSLGIPNFQELANAEMTKLYSYRSIKTYPVCTSIECLPPDVLGMYALACMNVLAMFASMTDFPRVQMVGARQASSVS